MVVGIVILASLNARNERSPGFKSRMENGVRFVWLASEA